MSRAPLGLGLLAALLLITSCGETPRPGRVLIIGIDGASPRVVGPMLGEGRLPNLAKIAEQGVSGRLRSVLPLFSPRIWNTIATGRKPSDHGVVAFVKKSDDKQKQLYLSHDRKVPALWNIVSSHGRSVGVVNWWTTFPPEKINGVMVSDHFFPEQIAMIKKTFKDERESAGSLIYPQTWTERADRLIADRSQLTAIGNPFKGEYTLPHWVNPDVLSRQFDTDTEITRVAQGLGADFDLDVSMIFLPGIDRISHWLWGNLEPPVHYPPPLRPTPEERAGGADALRAYYAYTDELIGLMIADYGPDDLVLVISDHGFEAGVSLMLLTGEHDTPAALDGVIFARGRGIAPGSRLGPLNVFDLAPTVLTWLGIPVPDNMPGQVPAFMHVPKPGRVASYDDLPIERLEAGTSVNEADIVEHLKALGYLETSTEEAEAADRASE
jgi:hypothetical protein